MDMVPSELTCMPNGSFFSMPYAFTQSEGRLTTNEDLPDCCTLRLSIPTPCLNGENEFK
jgi:hypothetical protein